MCSVLGNSAFSGEFLLSFGAAPFDCAVVLSSVRSALALPSSWLRVPGFSCLCACTRRVFVCSCSACEGFPCVVPRRLVFLSVLLVRRVLSCFAAYGCSAGAFSAPVSAFERFG